MPNFPPSRNDRDQWRPDGSPPDRKGILARLFENPENPLGWSLKLFTFRGIVVRIHLMTVIYIAGQLLWSIPESNGGFFFVAPSMLALFVVVLLHEFGHCFAARRVGGEADRIVMLPWGGLALTRPPHNWQANFWTTAGGPLVNVGLLGITSVALITCGMGSIAVFNPFQPLLPLGMISGGGSNLVALGKVTLWWFHYVNIAVLAFNLVLAMFPFDGGRLVQALLWSRTGYERATYASCMIGFAGAMIVGVMALIADKAMLITIALLGAWSCWAELRRLKGEADLVTGQFPLPIPEAEAAGPSKAELKEKEREAAEQAELDRVLAKIASSGMDSLSRAEKKTLEKATKKKQGG